MNNQPSNEIFLIAAYGSIENLQHFKSVEKCIDFSDQYGNSLLHYAAAHGNSDSVLGLLGQGASIDWTNALGWTPVMQACRFGHLEVVSLLSRHNANLKRKTFFGVTCISLAVSGGHLEVVELLVSLGCDIDAVDENSGFSPCLIGAHRSNLPCLRYLTARTTQFDVRNTAGTSRISLIEAAVLGEDSGRSLDVCRLLLAMGASPTTMNLGAKPAEVAMAMGRSELAQLLRQSYKDKQSFSKISSNFKDHINGNKPKAGAVELLEAVKSGDQLLIRDLLTQDRQYVVEWLSEDGATPLIYTSMFGHVKCCEMLIEAGCPVNTQDEVNGWTAIMQAVYHNHIGVVRLLIQHKANLELRSKNDLTVVDIALLCEEENKEVLDLLSPEKAVRKEHRRLQRKLKGLVLSDNDKSRAVSYSRTGSLWGLMSRRMNHLTAIDEESGHSGSRISSTVCKLTLPFRRVRRHDSKKVRFNDMKAADEDCKRNTADQRISVTDEYNNNLIPRPPNFVPPEMKIEETIKGIRAIHDALRAEQPNDFVNVLSEASPTSEESLTSLLRRAKCTHLAPVFAAHEVDLDTVTWLSESDLHEMGIHEPTEVHALIGAIKSHRRSSVS